MTPQAIPHTGQAPLATYANFCEVGHNALEFLIDFGQFRPELAAVQVHSRIVAGPVQTKLFSRLLADAVRRFEATHGPIADVEDEDALAALFPPAPDFERRARALRAGAPERAREGAPERARDGAPERARDGAPGRARDGAPEQARDGAQKRARDGAPDPAAPDHSPSQR